jgi:hypothetical protein
MAYTKQIQKISEINLDNYTLTHVNSPYDGMGVIMIRPTTEIINTGHTDYQFSNLAKPIHINNPYKRITGECDHIYTYYFEITDEIEDFFNRFIKKYRTENDNQMFIIKTLDIHSSFNTEIISNINSEIIDKNKKIMCFTCDDYLFKCFYLDGQKVINNIKNKSYLFLSSEFSKYFKYDLTASLQIYQCRQFDTTFTAIKNEYAPVLHITEANIEIDHKIVRDDSKKKAMDHLKLYSELVFIHCNGLGLPPEMWHYIAQFIAVYNEEKLYEKLNKHILQYFDE